MSTSLSSLPVICGHRGSRGEFPENTLLALRAGARAGALVLEADIQVAADGVIVMCHDIDTTRCFDKSVVVEETPYHNGLDSLRTLGKHQEPMPTLAQVLDALLHDDDFANTNLMIDVKRSNTPAVAEPLRQVLEAAAPIEKLQSRVILGVWRPTVLAAVNKHLPEFEVCFIGWRICDAYKFLSCSQVSAISLHYSSLVAPGGASLMATARKSNRDIYTWTVNDELQMEWAVSAGVKGIITDFPGRLSHFLDSPRAAEAKSKTISEIYSFGQRLRLWSTYIAAWLLVSFADTFPSLARGR